MFDLQQYYQLHDDPDAYWVLYDLCVENNLAFEFQDNYPIWLRYRLFYVRQSIGYSGPDLFSYINREAASAICGKHLLMYQSLGSSRDRL
jgi:hypothetical protein